MIKVKNIALDLIPADDTNLATYASGGVAVYTRFDGWKAMYPTVLSDIAGLGWRVIGKLKKDESYSLDPDGTDKERKICDALQSHSAG